MAGSVNFSALHQYLQTMETTGMQLLGHIAAHSTAEKTSEQPDTVPEKVKQEPVLQSIQTQPSTDSVCSSAQKSKAEKKIIRAQTHPVIHVRHLRRAVVLSEILAPPLSHRR